MAGAAKLLGGLDQQAGLGTGVMSGVATETAQVRLDVRFGDFGGSVAAPAALQNDLRLCPSIAFNLVGIAARGHMIGAWSVAAFTA